MRTKKALYSTLKINSLFHTEYMTCKTKVSLYMAPLDGHGNVDYKAIELYTGRCRLPSVRKARTARTRAYLGKRETFCEAIQTDLKGILSKVGDSIGQGHKVVVSVPEWTESIGRVIEQEFKGVQVVYH